MATQFRAKPSEMLLATSSPVGAFSNCLMLPSGRVMFTITYSRWNQVVGQKNKNQTYLKDIVAQGQEKTKIIIMVFQRILSYFV